MSLKTAKEIWEDYRAKEFDRAKPMLFRLGFELEEKQPHLGGERYLMQSITTVSGRKLILIGRRKKDGKRVVIKATSDDRGAEELRRERQCRQLLEKINFAYQTFFFPQEVLFGKFEGMTVSIQEFIEQDAAFLERPQKEQFDIALRAFKAQEGTHATTARHLRLISKKFDIANAKKYLELFHAHREKILKRSKDDTGLQDLLSAVAQELSENRENIEQYSGFLTHIDFVPHNFRVANDRIYLLDHSSLRFGNKYEGWARFLNFMALYNPPLESAFVQYVSDNRTPEESLSLRLMRLYRLAEIIAYYAETLEKSDGNLLKLNQVRIKFWSGVLRSIMNKMPIPREIIDEYKKTRDSLRSEDEKTRQIGLH